MNDFKDRTCGECYYWKDNKCRINPPSIIIDGRVDYVPRSSNDEACSLFSKDNKKQLLLED